MSVTIVADAKGALLYQLQHTPAVTTITTTIKGKLQGLAGGGFAIAITAAGGPGRLTLWTPIRRSRFDLHCYGPSGYEAMRLMRTVMAALEPVNATNGFTAANCRVTDITFEGESIESDDDGWERRTASIIVSWSEEPTT